MNNTFKFSVGEIVSVKEDLKIGAVYYSDCKNYGDRLSYSMSKNLGKEAKVITYDGGGYVLAFDGKIDDIHTYYDEMIEYPVDKLAQSEYTFNYEVEKLIENLTKQYYGGLVDKGLEERMFDTDPEGFQKLVDKYNSF